MKRLITLCAISLMSALPSLAQSQSTDGKVIDSDTGRVLSQAVITFHGPTHRKMYTGKEGSYSLSDLPSGKYTVTITAPGYEATQIEYEIGSNKPLPLIQLTRLREDFQLPVEDLNLVSTLVDDNGGIVDQGTLLTASKDPFNGAAGFIFSAARFRQRGYDSQYSDQYLNGLPMNDLPSGYSVWSLWGGLNDVVRNQTSSETFEPLESGFGGIGVSNNINMRASNYRAQRRLTYSNSNRTYSNRFMATYATGKLNNGWSLALALGRRSGNGEYSYARGTFYDSWSYFVSVEKQLNDNNALSLVAFMAPTKRGVASASTQEAYDLTGSNFYNPNMGRQSGQWRNARVRNSQEPVIQLSHYYDSPDDKLKVNTTIGTRFGTNSYSALNWYNAPDPRPDYYRYLPSYYTRMAAANAQDPTSAALYEEEWLSNPNMRYIDWDKLYSINRANEQDVYSSDGRLLTSGRKALYLIEERHTDQRELGIAISANYKINPSLILYGGANHRGNTTAYYDKVGDLLGADFLHDIDKYAERDFGSTDPSRSQIDLNNPDHIARQGDRFGYDYKALLRRSQVWGNLKYISGAIEGYVALSVTHSSMRRVGKQLRGLFPEDSFGNSALLRFTDLGAKLGATYRLSGRQYLVLNTAYIEQAPTFENTFVSPRTRNAFVEHPKSEKIISADLSYVLRLPWLRGRFTAFYTHIADRSRIMSFYDDVQASFSNYALSGIATKHIGAEIGLEAKISPTLSATGVLALGQYQYDSNPSYIQTIDNSNKIVDRNTVYWSGLNLSGTPQTAASLGLTYRAPWYATFGFNANYFGRNFVSMSPALRTDRARAAFDENIIKPERLRDGFTIDIFAGYSWRIKRDVYLRFNLSASNILNNKRLPSGGFEQLRIRTTKDTSGQTALLAPFDSKLSYVYGTTFFLNTSLQF